MVRDLNFSLGVEYRGAYVVLCDIYTWDSLIKGLVNLRKKRLHVKRLWVILWLLSTKEMHVAAWLQTEKQLLVEGLPLGFS